MFRRIQSGPACAQIVRLIDHFDFRGHACLVFEILDEDLLQFQTHFEQLRLPDAMVESFSRDMLHAVRHMGLLGIIHGDLKPENILVKRQQGDLFPVLRVIDLNTATLEGGELFMYLQTRYYRAPEMLLGCAYGCPIDMWSLGCIVIELLIGRPIFAGVHELEQMWKITQAVGLPPSSMLDDAVKVADYFRVQDSHVEWRDPLVACKLACSISSGLPEELEACPTSLSMLIDGCLKLEPSRRVSASTGLEILSHA